MLRLLTWFFIPSPIESNWHHESLKFLERDRHARSIDPLYYEVEDRSEAQNVRHKPEVPDMDARSLGMHATGHRESRARAIPA